MRIIFLVPSVEAGGAEKNIIELANHFTTVENFEVTLCAVNKAGAFVNRIDPSVNFVNLKSKKVSKSIFKLLILFLSKKPDIVFSTLPHLNFVTILLVNFLNMFGFRMKIIVRETSLPQSRGKLSLKMKLGYLIFYKLANQIIAQSTEMKNQLTNLTNSSKISVINNPVNITKVIKKSNSISVHEELFLSGVKNILILGRLEKVKGHLRILDFISENFKFKYHILIVGNGSEKENILRKVDELDLNQNTTFLNHVSNPYYYINKSDLLISGSYVEGFPNVILEAFALKKPFILLNQVGGGEEIVTKLNIHYRHLKKNENWNEAFLSNKDLDLNYEVFENNFSHLVIYKKYEELFYELKGD